MGVRDEKSKDDVELNGQDGHFEAVEEDPTPRRPPFVPKNLIEFVWALTLKFGFPALAAVALGWYIIKRDATHAELAKAAHIEFKAALDAQTAAVRESTSEQRKMTEALIRVDTKLETHLDKDDRRHR